VTLQNGPALLASAMRRINNMIACEGLVRCGETGVSTTLNAVRERSAVKVARSVLRGPYAREGMGLPS